MIEGVFSTIEGLLTVGFVFGMLVGVLAPTHKLGCFVLLTVPIAMIAYIAWWQGQHPEALRSTSGLDFLFGPLWPSLGAIAGLFAGKIFGEHLKGQ